MKMRKFLLTLFTALLTIPMVAQLSEGKIYRFINKADNSIAMTATSFSDVYGKKKTENDWTQYWYVEKHPGYPTAWAVRSLGNGLYLQWAGESSGWTFVTDAKESTNLFYREEDGYFTFNNFDNSLGRTCMHYATSQSGRIVGWSTDAPATWWSLEEQSLDEADINNNWEELNEFIEKINPTYISQCEDALENLFSDKACTTLKKNYANLGEIEADADYKRLPAELQNMVKKVYSGNWEEANFDSKKASWNSEQAKKFRIQSIEPYSVAGEITAHLGINAHINMDNPTGLFGNYRQHVYIIVEGEIKDGAELWLNTIAGHGMIGTHNTGIRLQEGLNVVPFSGNGNALYLNYIVHTYQDRRFVHKLSEFKDLKVHIEGGNINGYYNAVGDCLWGEPDDDEDWLYYESRANLENITILGRGQILHFCLNETPWTHEEDGVVTQTGSEKGMAYWLPERVQVPANTPANQKINTMVEAWDRIFYSELATMGLLSKEKMDSLNALYPRYNEKWEKAGNIYDYSDAMYKLQGGKDYSEYFNNHGLALGGFGPKLYMSGGWRNCNYNHNTMDHIIGDIATNAGSTWGPGHEIGHQHQGPLTVNGLTEVTNNLFSNISVWYMGLGTSRVNGSEGRLTNVNSLYQEGEHFLFHHQINGESQNLWTQTQMYYKLWLYYHRCGHKTDFYPMLYELLRQYPLSSGALGTLPHTDEEGKTYNISHTSGKASTLLFYKLACQAAGEDLTEFFRAYGFFAPLKERLRGDYSNSFYTQSQEEIDAVIAEVKSMNLKENVAPLFVNDCVATPTYGHDGKTQRSYWDTETKQNKNAELGLYVDAINKSTIAKGYYYSRSNKQNISIKKLENAAGALGFIIYCDGELVGFSDFYNTTLPAKYAEKVVQVYAVQANGKKVELPSALEVGTDEEKRAILKDELSISKDYYSSVATSTNNTGYFYAESTVDFKNAYDAALAVYNNKEAAKYVEVTETLQKERIALNQKEELTWIPIKEKNFYNIESYLTSGLSITLDGNALKATNSKTTPIDNATKLWEFVKANGENSFYIRNKDGAYVATIEKGSQVLTTKDVDYAGVFTPVRNTRGMFDIQQGAVSLRLTGAVVQGGDNNATASLWKLTVVEDNATEAEKKNIDKVIASGEALIKTLLVDADSDTPELNDKIVLLIEEEQFFDYIKRLRVAIDKAKAEKETAFDLYLYIAPIENLMNHITPHYIVIPDLPIASTTEKPVWYFIKSIEDNLYCAVDTKGTNAANKNALKLQSLNGDEGNNKLYWAFYPTGKEGEYTIKSAATGNEIYATDIWTGNGMVKADGSLPATTFTLTLVPDKYGFKIGANGSYLYRMGTSAYIYATGGESECRHWTIELVPEDIITGIEEITSVNNAVKGIYDMMGRKLNSIDEPGLYIVNGQKILIK